MKDQEQSVKPTTSPDAYADGWATEAVPGLRERIAREADRMNLPEGYERWPDHLQEGWNSPKP